MEISILIDERLLFVLSQWVPYYPGPRGFSWFFFAEEIKSKREAATTSRESDEQREKNLWIIVSGTKILCQGQK